MIARRIAEKAVERWENGGAFSFRSGDVTFVIDPSKILHIIQHDLTIKYGIVANVFIDIGVLTIITAMGSLGFEVQ